eukprot:953516-Prorocentrum_lima.AAC.1
MAGFRTHPSLPPALVLPPPPTPPPRPPRPHATASGSCISGAHDANANVSSSPAAGDDPAW